MGGQYGGVEETQQLFEQAVRDVKNGSIDPEDAAQEIDLALGGENGGIEDFDYRPNGNGIEATVMWEGSGERRIETVNGLPSIGAAHHLLGILSDTERIANNRGEYRARKYLEALKEEEEKAFDALLEQDMAGEVETYLAQTGRTIVDGGAGNHVVEQHLDEEEQRDVYTEVGTISFIYNELFDDIGRDARQKFRSRYGQHKTPRFEDGAVALEAKAVNRAINAGATDFRYIFTAREDGKKYRGIARHTGQNDQHYKWA